MADLSHLTPGQYTELEQHVGRFEAAWNSGAKPDIDDFLPQEPVLRQVVLVELVHVDLELRSKVGERVILDDYLARFPNLAADKRTMDSLIRAASSRHRTVVKPAQSPANSGVIASAAA